MERLRESCSDRPDDVMSTAHGNMALGFWHLHRDQTSAALDIFRKVARSIRESLCVNAHTILVMPNLAKALVRHAETIEDNSPNEALRLRRRALKAAAWGTRFSRLFPSAHPPALRERAVALAALGKTKQALKWADRSCSVAERQQARFELVQSQMIRSKIRRDLGLPDSEDEYLAAREQWETWMRIGTEACREADHKPLPNRENGHDS